MNLTLRLFGISGFIVFVLGFGLTFFMPNFVETQAKNFIKGRIQKEAQERIQQIDFTASDNVLSQMASKLLNNKQAEIAQIKAQLNKQIYTNIDTVIEQMSDLSCECRKTYENLIELSKQSKISNMLSLQKASAMLQDFMRGKYMQVSHQLITDFRIFTGANALIFMLITLISFLKPQAVKHLFLPAILLLVATLISSYFYLFQQNWFFTIMYNDYLGYAYLAYLSIALLFLIDILINKGKRSTLVITTIFSAVGIAVTIVSC